jgi:restriction endonuclease S subunit
VANPPFAVKGFLLNLSDPQKLSYELIKTTDLNSDTNNIQCFFIERAKQLMAADGIVGIIVPSSVLSNSDATHIATREILLKYFDMIALVELGGGTFGKTGTNTVVLFLRRKSKRPEPAEHYWNRVEDYFEGIKAGDPSTAEYQDGYLIQKYCEHTELPLNEYKKLLTVSVATIAELDELFKTDMFSDYQKDFIGSTEIKNLRKQRSFKAKTQAEQNEELNKCLISYLHVIEKDKLFYFMLAHENPQKVLIIKSPSDNKKQKQFLGYEWSGAKGSEGIKYSGGSTVNEIITPLFDPRNTDNPEKINFLIQQNFLGAEPNDLKDFEPYKDLISYVNVAELLDFSRKDFNKSFSLSPKRNIRIDSKWELVKLGKVALYVTDKINFSDINTSDYITTDNLLKNRQGVIEYSGTPSVERVTRYQEKDILISNIRPYLKKIWIADKKGGCSNDVLVFRSTSPTEVMPKYLFNLLSSDVFFDYVMSGKQGVKMPRGDKGQIIQFPTPVPSQKIQKKIVSECDLIDQASEKAQGVVDKAEQKIEEMVKAVFNAGFKSKKLSEICDLKAGNFVSASDIKDENAENLYPCYGGNGLRGYTKTYTHQGTFSLIGRQGALCGNVHKVSGTFHATEHAVVVTPASSVDSDWFYYILKSLNLNQYATGVAQPGISVKNIKPVTIPIPPLNKQQQLITEIEKLEKQISTAKIIIASAVEKKQAVMDKYLKE